MFSFLFYRVDGFLLYHGYAHGGRRQECRQECPCGPNTGEPNDIHSLCKAMLQAHKISEPLIAAYVSSYSLLFLLYKSDLTKIIYDVKHFVGEKYCENHILILFVKEYRGFECFY